MLIIPGKFFDKLQRIFFKFKEVNHIDNPDLQSGQVFIGIWSHHYHNTQIITPGTPGVIIKKKPRHYCASSIHCWLLPPVVPDKA